MRRVDRTRVNAARRRRGWIRWLFEDRRSGRLVIGQAPNTSMLLSLAASGARMLLRRHRPSGATARYVQGTSLAFWAIDEVLRGVNPFRRIGGAVVLVASLLWSRSHGSGGSARRR